MEHSMLPTQVMLGAALFTWLGICTIFDLRSRQVPTLLTVIPLILAADLAAFPEWLDARFVDRPVDFDLRPATGKVAHSDWLLCCDRRNIHSGVSG